MKRHAKGTQRHKNVSTKEERHKFSGKKQTNLQILLCLYDSWFKISVAQGSVPCDRPLKGETRNKIRSNMKVRSVFTTKGNNYKIYTYTDRSTVNMYPEGKAQRSELSVCWQHVAKIGSIFDDSPLTGISSREKFKGNDCSFFLAAPSTCTVTVWIHVQQILNGSWYVWLHFKQT